MAYEGMDVEVVEGVGRQLRQRGSQVDALVAEVDRMVSQGADGWDGADAQRFVSDWQHSLRSSALQASRAVIELGQRAQENAAAQRAVSEAGSTVSTSAGPAVRMRLPTGEQPGSIWAGVSAITGLAGLGANANLTGDYTKGYSRVLRAGSGLVSRNFLRYKTSFNGPFRVNGPVNAIDSAINKHLPYLGAVGKVLAVPDMYHSAERAMSADLPTSERVEAGVDFAATGLKTSRLPPLYLSGVALSAVNTAWQEAGKADFSPEGRDLVYNEVKTHPTVILDVLGDPKTWTPIWKIFS